VAFVIAMRLKPGVGKLEDWLPTDQITRADCPIRDVGMPEIVRATFQSGAGNSPKENGAPCDLPGKRLETLGTRFGRT
jgi:hypothetical protein